MVRGDKSLNVFVFFYISSSINICQVQALLENWRLNAQAPAADN